MNEIDRIFMSRQPRRPHHIKDWMERRELSQADLSRELGADKSVVSRWIGGATPGAEWQRKLAVLFRCSPEALFRHPDDDWLAQILKGRTPDEIDRIKKTLEAAFPIKK